MMSKGVKGKLEKALSTYFKEIDKTYTAGNFREESFYPALKELLLLFPRLRFINKEQYFEGVSKEVWEYRIGAYQVMDKYLKDRKKRKLSLDEINHYMRVAKAIRLTMELQEKIDDAYRKGEV